MVTFARCFFADSPTVSFTNSRWQHDRINRSLRLFTLHRSVKSVSRLIALALWPEKVPITVAIKIPPITPFVLANTRAYNERFADERIVDGD